MKKTIAKNVKGLREARRITQIELAGKCGLLRTYLSRIETGSANPSLTVIVLLAHALEVMPHELLLDAVPAKNDARHRAAICAPLT